MTFRLVAANPGTSSVLKAGYSAGHHHPVQVAQRVWLPFAVVVMRRDCDQWEPGEHNRYFPSKQPLPSLLAWLRLEHFWTDV